MFHAWNSQSPRFRAIFEALFVTFLWSTSWVLIKIGLQDIPPITFAGLRYALAFVCLCPFAVLNPRYRDAIRSLSGRQWLQLVALGVVFIAIAQGAQYLALNYLPADSVTLLLNFSAVLVALLGIPFLNERPSFIQWFGIALFLGGVVIYFYPTALGASLAVGIIAAAVCVTTSGVAALQGRHINRAAHSDPFVVTFVSIGVGALLLLGAGLSIAPMPTLSLLNWLSVGWLAAVNTAFAFTLWNRSQQSLSAVESSMINNTMMIQIAVLAWLFLGEHLDGKAIAGMALAAVGTLLVQLRRDSVKPTPALESEAALLDLQAETVQEKI
ncbi:MAG TPA: DMT family transporter [Aggregatilineales bacterium]|nr:DMT family transporter [Aggregatilineales bacterium]